MKSNKIKNTRRIYSFLYFMLNIWKRFLNVSLRIKLIGLAVFTTLFLGFAIVYFMLSFYRMEISHDAKFMSEVVGRHIAYDATSFILHRNINQLNNLLRNEIKNNKSILYIFYRNNKGIIAASAFRSNFRLNILDNASTVKNNRNRLSTIKSVNDAHGKFMDISVPVSDGKLGIIRVGVSVKQIKAPFLRYEGPPFYKYISLILIFTAVLLYLIFTAIAWRFSTPVVELWKAAEKIKKGDYDVYINNSSDDEIGKLSKAFNEMTLSLKEAEQKRIKNENLRKNFISGVINAQEEERKNISRDLHDRVGQFLSYLKIKLKMLDDINDLNEIKNKIHQIRGDLTEGLDLIRDIAKNLRPGALDEIGLISAIDIYINDVVKNSAGIKIYFYPVNFENYRLDKHLDIIIYRVVQEAVLNVILHASANFITIILEKHEGKIKGIVKDNGTGFDYCEGNEDYLGINGMKERVKLFGGELTIESEMNLGTAVKFQIPIPVATNLEGGENDIDSIG